MNDQNRGSPTDFSQLNPLTKIHVIENYRGYKRILFLRPFGNSYLGYFDKDFFGYTVSNNTRDLWLMEPQQAIDYYLDKLFFHNPVLEYDTFRAKPEYKIYLNSLRMKKDGN